MEKRSKQTKLSHKEWRCIVKKERRRRKRRLLAQERDANEERLRAALENNVEYMQFCAEKEKQEKETEAREQEKRAERERLWLEEEIRAQKKWQELQEQKAKEEQEKLEQDIKIREKLEAKRVAILKKKDEEKRKQEEQFRKQEQLQKEINDYIDNGVETPEILREIVDNQPTKELCPFFSKTGACRYGNACSKNHRKFFLSRVILIPGFYSHFSLEKNLAEYDTDVALEFERSETLHHFYEFYEDVITELESFGRIKTLKCCCNKEIHLRGNVYVQYYTEREAARAWRNLKGRWYAGRQLNCEFVNFTSWRSAVCGINKCPKGSKFCNFLHTFRNPHNKYDIKSPRRDKSNSNDSKRSEHRSKSKWEESDRDNSEKDRSWRWSESPETESDRSKDRTKHFHSTKRKRSQISTHNKRQRKNFKLTMKSSKIKISPRKKHHHHHSHRKRIRENKDEGKEYASNNRPSKRIKRNLS
ncbi:PREDICTED: U2 small nuclear ribonucleoprotein auxiliary factor 35 kDa subunit-related protein 1 [Cyphomyrmex costatus]|uniref:U2 small nuclear ribonucleoprotein auxiliary factor 35 kDa subunit-related protein 1 n=1 Tax=Cyphomyrmex costatus TaxID=456900 RepID=A0A195BXT0_9HYME|nr:PREDICTED: U2 small nuclear ribonucleoprotein auxiliary factor 35 kDa subunit-related protein 1 [Cyphomyrmex costatus]XP_018405817.1 PREDICTED: U2 small nuclear ribonucleoprotein auxiliary factor 35 kDa subunit-related protein 1 [Cyphomyrmex costatus]KYM93464.1 U2 small nuclear ribonucleoprotein auxiliary factor 35 kDa subunit-related protein 1 [Cyphomyrmex costatus]